MSAIIHLAHRVRRGRLPEIYYDGSLWYAAWYFDLRLEEELARASRYELPVTLVSILLTDPPKRRQLEDKLSTMTDLKVLRRSDIPAVLNEQKFAILLPHTRPEQAAVVARRLERVFAPYAPLVGCASFPDDGNEAEELLIHAEHQALRQAPDTAALSRAVHLRTRPRSPRPV